MLVTAWLYAVHFYLPTKMPLIGVQKLDSCVEFLDYCLNGVELVIFLKKTNLAASSESGSEDLPQTLL